MLEGNKVITVKSDMPEINIFNLVLNSSAVAPNSSLLKVLLLECGRVKVSFTKLRRYYSFSFLSRALRLFHLEEQANKDDSDSDSDSDYDSDFFSDDQL